MSQSNQFDIRKFEEKALQAYEASRFRRSLRPIPLILAISALALFGCRLDLAAIGIVALLLAGVSSFFIRKGQGLDKGVYPGLLLSALSALPPILFHAQEVCCRTSIEKSLCFGISVFAGVAIVAMSRRLKESARGFLVSASVVTMLGAGLSCISLGMGPALILAGGIALFTTPAYLLTPVRSHS